MSERTFRVRYGKVRKSRFVNWTKSTPEHTEIRSIPKTTLVTFREEDTIYFGISRCNSNLDTFSKFLGKRIAENRAVLAKSGTTFTQKIGTVSTHESGLRGSIDVSNIKDLINYFYDIDRVNILQLNGQPIVVGE